MTEAEEDLHAALKIASEGHMNNMSGQERLSIHTSYRLGRFVSEKLCSSLLQSLADRKSVV